MANPVWHVELQLKLELNHDDLGHPEIPGLWDLLYAQDRSYATQRVSVPNRGLQCAGVCRDQGVVAWMYLRESSGRREAVHQRAEDEARHSAPESDEHKAYKERTLVVAESAGHYAETEVTAPGRRIRTDALVHGPDGLRIGFEFQMSGIASGSAITPGTVRYRFRQASEAGITPAWHTDRRDLGSRNDAHWTRSDKLPPEAIRHGRDLQVWTGVRRLIWERCDRMPTPCPVKRTGSCGKHHALPEPSPIPFDDLVRKAASGELVPLDFKLSTRVNRFWVPAADRDRYLDAGGAPVDEDDETESPDRTSQDRPTCRPQSNGCVGCGRPAGLYDVTGALRCLRCHTPPEVRRSIFAMQPLRPGYCDAGLTPCGRPARFYPAGWRCDEHRPGRQQAA